MGLLHRNVAFDQLVPIITSSIDDLLEEYNIQKIDFLKLDLEGFDYFALLGARRSISMGKIDIIQFEVTRCWEESGASPCAAFRFLNNSNYEIYLLKRDSLFKIKNIENIKSIFLCGLTLSVFPKDWAIFGA